MKRLFRSFGFALKGISSVFSSEPNMKIHVGISVFVVLMGFLLRISANEWLVCILCMGLVFSAEMFNTAIETVVNLVSPEKNPLAGKAKDISAGAVFLTAVMSVAVGVIIFLPKIWNLFFH